MTHGTPTSWKRCQDGHFGPCRVCKDARNARVYAWRDRKRALKAAEEAARHRLASAYPEVFAALVAAELKAAQEGETSERVA